MIYVTDEWKLKELPVVVNRSREGWDIYISFNNVEANQDIIAEELVIDSLSIDHLFLSNRGLEELAKANSMTSTINLSDKLRVRVIESSDKIKIPQRESLATASRFAIILLDVRNKAPTILVWYTRNCFVFLGLQIIR